MLLMEKIEFAREKVRQAEKDLDSYFRSEDYNHQKLDRLAGAVKNARRELIDQLSRGLSRSSRPQATPKNLAGG
jgi:hypothetical protein